MAKETRGGKRAGSGRPKKPPKEYSEKFKKDLQKALKKQQRLTGKSLQDILVEIIYSDDTQDAVRVGGIKEVGNILVAKEIKKPIDSNQGVVVLPPSMEPPQDAIEDKTTIEAVTSTEESPDVKCKDI